MLLGQENKLDSIDSVNFEFKSSHNIGLLFSSTEGFGFSYRYWSSTRFGFGVSLTPYFIYQYPEIINGVSILYKLSKKHQNRYPFVNVGGVIQPLNDFRNFIFGAGIGYEWFSNDVMFFNLKLDVALIIEDLRFAYNPIFPLPGLGITFKI